MSPERTNYWRRGVSRRRLLQASAASAGALALAACGGGSGTSKTPTGSATQPAGSSPQASKGGTLRYGNLVDFTWTQMPYSVNSFYYLQEFAVYDTLFRYNDASTLEPTPRLAAGYEFNDDKSEIVVELKPNLTFHDGKALDAQAVVDSFTSLNGEDTAPSQVQGVAKAYISKAEAVDPTHVKFSLVRPGNVVFDVFHWWLIADATNIAALNDGGIPNGSGPFKVTSVQPKQGAKLAAFPDYWQPAQLDNLEYLIYPDASGLALSMQSGAIDLAKELSADDVKTFESDGKHTVYTDKGLASVYCMGMNTKGEVTKDPRIRQALHHSLDRARVTEDVLLGAGQPFHCLWPTTSKAYESRYDADPFDLKKAKELVTGAGYTDGTPDIEVMLSTTDTGGMQIFQILQADAKKAGLNLVINQLERSAFSPKFQQASYPGCYMTTFGYNATYPDTLFVMNFQVRVPNSTGFESDEYKKFQSDMAAATDDETRAELYKKFNEIWDENMWVVLSSSRKLQWVRSKKVATLDVNDYSMPDTAGMALA
jgi:peptide/nickel transport system substrate-binding protein